MYCGMVRKLFLEMGLPVWKREAAQAYDRVWYPIVKDFVNDKR